MKLSQLSSSLNDLGVDDLPNLTKKEIAQLNTLTDLFLSWNRKLNLSSIRDRDGIIIRHIVDSLLILPYLHLNPQDRVLDLGTGGGFPGLPLAIIYPQVEFTLMDATKKKIDAVQTMATELGLTNVSTEWGRAEELGHREDLRQHFDLVVARALAGFSTLLEYCLPFVRPAGTFIAYQGPDILNEVKPLESVIQKLGGKLKAIHESVLPGEGAKRVFIDIEKVEITPKIFPRRSGIPKKKPLAE